MFRKKKSQINNLMWEQKVTGTLISLLLLTYINYQQSEKNMYVQNTSEISAVSLKGYK